MIDVISVPTRHISVAVISQNTPLHRYPMHALRVLNEPSNDADLHPMDVETARLIALAQVHSRFVLLLQSLVHSAPPSPASSELDDSLGLLSSPGPSGLRSASGPVAPGVRELVFPAPLSYFSPPAPPTQKPGTIKGKGHRRSQTSFSATPASPPPTIGRASADFQALIGSAKQKGRLRRVSVFGGAKFTPPPPPAEPTVLKHYAHSWRRSTHFSASALSDDEGSTLR